MKYARPAPISGWSPIRFLLAVLAITFAVELGVMFLLPVLLPLATPEWTRAVVDAGLLTLISAPILWWLFIHPLRGIALAEQARSAAIVGAAVEGIITMDGEGVLESFNPGAERIFGYAAAEVRGRNIRLLLPSWAPQQRDRRVDALPDAGRTIDLHACRKDGTEFPVEISVAGWERDGATCYSVIIRDVTERKAVREALRESEERYRDLFEHANDFIQSVAPDGSILYVNQAWRAALGYTEQEISSLSLLDVIHPDSKAHCMELFQRVMAGDAVPRAEVTFVTKAGRAIVAEGSVNCNIKNGRPVATRAIFRDVTERKRAEEQLTDTLKTRADFVSFVTHQLRTPLTGIKWMLELAAQESDASSDLGSHISDARASAERLIRLVNDLLNAARLESGTLSMVLQETHLGPLTQSVIDELAGLIQEKGHRLLVAGGEDRTAVLVEPQLIRPDLVRIRREPGRDVRVHAASGEVRQWA